MTSTRDHPILVFVAGVIILSSTGWVSSSKYEAVKREAEQTQRELQKERQKMLEVEKVHVERKKTGGGMVGQTEAGGEAAEHQCDKLC